MALNEQLIRSNSLAHPRPDVTFSYGTAGFRTSADVLDSVLYRVGLLAALRSKKLRGDVIGVMVTASHNPEKDNGVKLVDPHGEMLTASWEAYATLLANATTEDALISALNEIITATKIDLSTPCTVIYGYDTRPSCPALIAALEDGLDAAGATKLVAGLVTTPQLHYLVRCHKTIGTPEAYGEPTIAGYYAKLATAYKTLAKGRTAPSTPLTVDCANGVGAPKLKEFLAAIGSDVLPLHITRDDTTTLGALNYQSGADYVKTQQKAPPGTSLVPGQRYCSFDGDADRIVFYYADAAGTFHLLDGDKIAGLVAGFLIQLVKDAGLDLQVGVVQTAYANGASTKYLKNILNVPVSCVPTGVKHLHHAASSYDIGVYFEANGHGTVLFSGEATTLIATASPTSPSHQSRLADLLAITELINQTVGDALSDMLLVETILLHRSWGPLEWDQAYVDLPNRLVKVFVQDRHAFSTSDAERKVETPAGLQSVVDLVVAKYAGGRSFVRPSGTEDCVRVYAEAASRKLADALAQEISGVVFDLCGKGAKPARFT